MNLPAFDVTADGRPRQHLDPAGWCNGSAANMAALPAHRPPCGHAECSPAACIYGETFAEARRRKRRIAETERLGLPSAEIPFTGRLRVEDHPVEPLLKGGQGRECSPAMAIMVLICCIALPVFAVVAFLLIR